MKQLTILGSTGSIGTNTLAVVAANPQQFSVKALVAGYNVDLMTEQCLRFHPDYAAMADEASARLLRQRLHEQGVKPRCCSAKRPHVNWRRWMR